MRFVLAIILFKNHTIFCIFRIIISSVPVSRVAREQYMDCEELETSPHLGGFFAFPHSSVCSEFISRIKIQECGNLICHLSPTLSACFYPPYPSPLQLLRHDPLTCATHKVRYQSSSNPLQKLFKLFDYPTT